MVDTTSASEEVAALLRGYYHALETGESLEGFYATEAEARDLGPPVKVGSERGEFFVGYAAIAAEVRRVTSSLVRNRLESRGPIVRRRGDLAWFADQVWWSAEAEGRPFASTTRWTGVCLNCPGGWKLVQLHVSEEA